MMAQLEHEGQLTIPMGDDAFMYFEQLAAGGILIVVYRGAVRRYILGSELVQVRNVVNNIVRGV